MNIIIDLDNTETRSFSENEFIHIEAKKQFLSIIENRMAMSFDYQDRVHNAIFINGKRGYGKTSFILSIKEIIEKDFKDIFVLKIIDPTIIETKENIFILVLNVIKKEVDKCLNNYCQDINQNTKKEFENILKEIAGGLNVLDGIGGTTLYKENIWNEPELILQEALKNVKGGSELENNFKKFLDISLKILNKKAFLLIFDDIDTALEQGEMILELLRKYFTYPKLFVVLLGDVELFNLIVRNMQWKKLKPNYIKDYEKKLLNGLYKDEIDTLTEQYMIKILKNENVIHLKSLYELSENIIIKNNGKLNKYLYKIIYKLTKEKNNIKLRIILEYFLSLPLRTIIQILKSNGDFKSLQYILFANIGIKYSKNLLMVLESFYNHTNDKFYLLYNYIKDLKPETFDYTFMPSNSDISKNSLNILLNTHISNSINSIQDICDYFVKFYMPIVFGCSYDYNTHSFKISRYLNKDLRAKNLTEKVFKGTIEISNDEFKRLNLNEEDQSIFNIFTVGLFTKNGLKNYFSFWNIFGFISDLFYFNRNINLDKLLQVRSFALDEVSQNNEDDIKSNIQEAKYNTILLRALVVSENTRFDISTLESKSVDLSNRQLNSIFTRIEYAIKYIDDNPSPTLSEQLKRYIQATLNAFIIVVLENEQGIRFNNALSLNSSIYKNNLKILEKHRDKYLWLYSFIELKIWSILEEFSNKLDKIILSYKFEEEFEKINFDGELRIIKSFILENSDKLYQEDVKRVINSIKQRKTIEEKLKRKLVRSLEKIKENLKPKPKNDNN